MLLPWLASAAEHAPRPAPDAVFEAYLRVRGGQAALESMVVVERIGSIAVEAGGAGLLAGTYHTCLRYPDRVAIEIDAGPWQLAQALRAEGAVACRPGFTDCVAADQALSDELTATARDANKELLRDAHRWHKARVTPTSDGQGWRLTLTTDGRWAEFDKHDGSLVAEGGRDHWRRYSRWRPTGQVRIAHRLEDYAATPSGPEWKNTVQLETVTVSDHPSAWCAARFGD